MIPFTKDEKNTIGDFVHANEVDTLIISECTALVEVLANHELITNKEELLKKLADKSLGIIGELKEILMTKVSKQQGSEIMDEYYGKKPNTETVPEKVKEEEKPQHYRWGAGNEKNSKPFDTVKIGGSEFELIYGEYPHSRKDNTTYARNKNNPEDIYDFDGHRIPFKIEIEESNYIKRSGLSGDEVRKSCSGKLFLDGKQIFECGGRTYERAFKNIEQFIDSMEQEWSWYPNNLNEKIGKIIKYEGQLFKIQSFILSQACMILVTPDEKPRKPFPSEAEDVENDDFERENSIKVEINSPHIWWYPTEKEMAPYLVKQ